MLVHLTLKILQNCSNKSVILWKMKVIKVIRRAEAKVRVKVRQKKVKR